MSSSRYLKLWEEANKRKIKLSKKQEQEIKQIFFDFYLKVNKKLSSVKEYSLSERYLKEFKKYLELEFKNVNKEVSNIIEKNAKLSGEIACNVQLEFFQILDKEFNLGLDESFYSIFITIATKATEEILSGGMYKDRQGLSKRIWKYANKFKKDIDYIVSQGLLCKKTSFEIAKDLETYVNPKSKKNFEFSKIYPNVNKVIDYNALRLARTAINHAFQQSQRRSAEKNPYTKGIRWRSSLIHSRTCKLCKERHNKLYSTKNIPLDHPNGLCTTIVELDRNLNNIAFDLKDWLNGGSNPKLDKAFEEYKITKIVNSNK